jgi:hypothetical protein
MIKFRSGVRNVIILLAGVRTAFGAEAQSTGFESCDVAKRLAGQWNWQSGTWHSDPPPPHAEKIEKLHGAFEFAKIRRTSRYEIGITWLFPREQKPRNDVFFIQSPDSGAKVPATHLDEASKSAACDAEFENAKCALLITCPTVFPQKYTFFLNGRDELGVQFLGPPPHHHAQYVPVYSGEGRRKR